MVRLFINITYVDGFTLGSLFHHQPVMGWAVPKRRTKSGYPAGGSQYVIQMSTKNLLIAATYAKNETSTVEYDPSGVWLSRVKCSLSWEMAGAFV